MKLKELNEGIAAACNVRANVVSQVQAETFRALRAALDRGEKVIVPEFGVFLVREVSGEEGAAGKKMIRFRVRGSEGKKGKAAAAAAGKNAGDDAPDDDGDED